MNSATMNMGVQISFQDTEFSVFGYVLRSGMAGSYSSSIFFFLATVHCMWNLSSLIRDLIPTTCSGIAES